MPRHSNDAHRLPSTAPPTAQFITTTFRPELVEVASKCYGIALQSKVHTRVFPHALSLLAPSPPCVFPHVPAQVSNIYPLDKSDAQNFVTNLMNEEEAVGQVSSVPAFSRANRQKQEAEEEAEVAATAAQVRAVGRVRVAAFYLLC